MSNKHKNKQIIVESKPNSRKMRADIRKEKRLTAHAQRKLAREEYLNSIENKVLTIARQQKAVKRWYKLDNAALMYPITAYAESDHVFRMSVVLKQPVDAISLQLAINKIFTRFPTMTGAVRSGIFWPYIDKPSVPLIAILERDLPCRPMPMDGKHPQTRVLYYGNQIACEFFHSATDGTGGLIFLNSLLLAYFDILGNTIDDVTNAEDYRDNPNIEEITDKFTSIAVKRNPPPLPKVVKASHVGGIPLPNKIFICRKGICSATQLKSVAKQLGATVTELIGALQLMAIDELNRHCNYEDKRPIRLLVPVNLRKIYNLNTLRNFSSYIFYTYNGQEKLQDVIIDIQNQTREQLNDNYFRGMVSYNYNNGNHPLLKLVPLALKKIVIRAVVNSQGEGVVNSGTLSNVGVVACPQPFGQYIDRYDFTLGKGSKRTINFAVATYGDVCVISVSNSLYETTCERYFFTTLAKLGVDITIESDIVEGLE